MHPFLALLSELVRDPAHHRYLVAQVFYAIKYGEFYGKSGLLLKHCTGFDFEPLAQLFYTVIPSYAEQSVKRLQSDTGVLPSRPFLFDVERFKSSGQDFFSNPNNIGLTAFGGDIVFMNLASEIVRALNPPPYDSQRAIERIGEAFDTYRAENKAALKKLKLAIR